MSVPRGFFELANPNDFPGATIPAFVRGILMDRAMYDQMPLSHQAKLCFPPHVVIYGGPIYSIEEARQWNEALFFWSVGRNKVWVCGEVAPVVPNKWVPWPADSSFKWTWVNEPTQPRRVVRVFKNGGYQLEWIG